MLIVGWCSSNIRTEAIWILDSVPLMCLNHYVISHVVSSCLLYPTAPSLILPSPITRPLPPTPSPSYQIVLPPPVPIISEPPMTLAYAPSSCRGTELSASQCTARPCYATLIYNTIYSQSLTPQSLPLAVGITIPPPPISLAVSLLSSWRPHFEIFPGLVPCRGSAPTYMNQMEALPVPSPFKTSLRP